MRNQRENEINFSKIVGIGPMDYIYSVRLLEQEAISLKLNINEINTIKDVESLFQNEEIRNKIILEKKFLVNMLTFINKTSNNKVLAEFLSINSLNSGNENKEFIEKVRNDFDDNYLYLIQRDILPHSKLTLKLDLQGKKYILMEGKENSESVLKENDQINSNKQDLKDQKPKGLNDDINQINKIYLPNVERIILNKETETFPEGKQDDVKRNINQLSPIILSNHSKYRQFENDNTLNYGYNGESINNYTEGNQPNSNKSGLEMKLNYEFEICDYIFIDLNDYLNLKELSLSNLYEFFTTCLLPKCLNTYLAVIFPSMEKVKQEDISILVKLISISRFTVFDMKDAISLYNQLGYKYEETNFTENFISLREFNRTGHKINKTIIFFDNFSSLSVISYDSLSNQININEEYKFNIGFKISFFNAISLQYEFLKSTFLGGFFSKLIKKNFNYNSAFEIGLSTLKKVLMILDENSMNYKEPENPDYFIYNGENSLQKLNNYYSNFNSERKSYYKYSNQDDQMNTFYPKGKLKLKKINNSNLNKIDYLSQTQKKFMGILQNNQQLERKLKKFFSTIPESEFKNNYDLNELNKIGRTSFQKIVLKPIEEKPKIVVQKNDPNQNAQIINQSIDKKQTQVYGDTTRSPIKYHENTYHNLLDASISSNNYHQTKKEFKDYQYFDRKFASNKYKHMQQNKQDPYTLNYNPLPQNDKNELKENIQENIEEKPSVPVYKGIYVLAQTDNDIKLLEKERKLEEESMLKRKEEERKNNELKKIEEQKNLEKKRNEEIKKQEEAKKQKKNDEEKVKEEPKKPEENDKKKNDEAKKLKDIQEDIVEDLSGGHFIINKKNEEVKVSDTNKESIKSNNKEVDQKTTEGINKDKTIEEKITENKSPEEKKLDNNKDTKEVEQIKEELPKSNDNAISVLKDEKNIKEELNN